MTKAVIVIPACNEEENISLLVEEIIALRIPVEITIVNDASSDETGEIAEDLARRYPAVHVVHRSVREGLHAVYLDGFRRAMELEGEYVITMDADFSHHPSDLPRLLEADDATDLVIGSRYVPGGRTEDWGISRKLLSWGGGLIGRVALGVAGVRDCTSGFKRYRKEFAASFLSRPPLARGYAFQVESVLRAKRENLSIFEVPIVFRDRERGSSKMGVRELLRFLFSAIRIRFRGK